MKNLLRIITIVSTILLTTLISGCQNQSPVYTPGLGEIMTATQMRHAKLWFAGKANNWQLANYELFELQEGLDDAIKFHPKRTELLEEMIDAPMQQLKLAVAAKDNSQFTLAFKKLTESCNNCHKATEFGFNIVIIPTTNLYSNQSFEVSP